MADGHQEAEREARSEQVDETGLNELVVAIDKATSAAYNAERAVAAGAASLAYELNVLVEALRELHEAGSRCTMEVPLNALGFADEGGSMEAVQRSLHQALENESALARSASLQSQRFRTSLDTELRSIGITPD